jgi:hypothetical protein
MSYYGTHLLARAEVMLVELPAVKSSFGSMWHRLTDHGDGWQSLYLSSPLWHQWPTVGAGPAPIAAVTGAPALAAWVSESVCVHLTAALPDGSAWTTHVVPRREGPCCYDHHKYDPLRLPAGLDPPAFDPVTVTTGLHAWAVAAGFSTSTDRLHNALVSREPFPDWVYDLFTAVGLPPGREIPRLFDYDEDEWFWAWHGSEAASLRVGRRWSAGPKYRPEPGYNTPEPGDDELLRFLDLVADSIYGRGLTREEIAAEAARLTGKWPRLRPPDRTR